MLSMEGLYLRTALFRCIRNFFQEKDFLEVDTPVRQPVLIPESTILPIASGSWFLQTSPEQCMKRLLARGCSRIFQICPCFRAHELGERHLEEFTMLEWYRCDSTYRDLMTDCEKLLRQVLKKLSEDPRAGTVLAGSCLGTMRLDEPWERLSVEESFEKYAPIPLDEALAGKCFDEIIVEHIEPRLGLSRPTFLYDYPAECASLSCLKEGDARFAERFELYIGGMELANGFSELTDVDEQKKRFATELRQINSTGGSAQMPVRFLEDLEKIGQAAGIAFGLDRLLMLLLGAETIDDVVSFPPDAWL